MFSCCGRRDNCVHYTHVGGGRIRRGPDVCAPCVGVIEGNRELKWGTREKNCFPLLG
jgi:hypothetical protein